MAVTTVEERLSRLEGVYEHLASKADVARVETQVAELRTELKGDIAGLRAEMHRGNASLIRWVVGFMLVGVGAMTAIVGYLG